MIAAILSQAKKSMLRNDFIYKFSVKSYLRIFQPANARRSAKSKGLTINFNKIDIDIIGPSRTIRISKDHAIYLQDVIQNFSYYADAVEADSKGMVDYSKPNLHHVRGFDLHPIRFPSLAEPTATTKQYLGFANLSEGSIAIDLGAYSGLTSIMFRELCGDGGRVIAVDADRENLTAIRENFETYESKTGKKIDLLEGAVWTHSDGISFSSEGNMGSSAVEFVGDRLGAANFVPSFTLSDIAKRFKLERIDFIKCDIEGGESEIFNDKAFFAKFRPRIITEVHSVLGTMTTDAVMHALAPHGYRFKMVQQAGDGMPLIECWVDQ